MYILQAPLRAVKLPNAQTETVAFDFTVNRISLGGDTLSYLIDFAVGDSNCGGKGASCDLNLSGVIPTGTGTYEVTGTQTFSIPAGTLTSAGINFDVYDDNSTTSVYTVTKARFTETNGTVPVTVTPEPVSLLLAGTGMALAALKRRRRKSAYWTSPVSGCPGDHPRRGFPGLLHVVRTIRGAGANPERTRVFSRQSTI